MHHPDIQKVRTPQKLRSFEGYFWDIPYKLSLENAGKIEIFHCHRAEISRYFAAQMWNAAQETGLFADKLRDITKDFGAVFTYDKQLPLLSTFYDNVRVRFCEEIFKAENMTANFVNAFWDNRVLSADNLGTLMLDRSSFQGKLNQLNPLKYPSEPLDLHALMEEMDDTIEFRCLSIFYILKHVYSDEFSSFLENGLFPERLSKVMLGYFTSHWSMSFSFPSPNLRKLTDQAGMTDVLMNPLW